LDPGTQLLILFGEKLGFRGKHLLLAKVVSTPPMRKKQHLGIGVQGTIGKNTHLFLFST